MSSKILSSIAKGLGSAERALLGDATLKYNLSRKELAQLRKYVSEAGRATDASTKGGSGIRRALVGSTAAPDIIKARYRQGGLIGPGGVFLGDLAMSEALRQSLKRTGARLSGRAVQERAPSIGRDLRTMAAGIPSQGLNLGFGLGFPVSAALAAQSMDPRQDDGGLSGVGRALGSGLGYLGAAPFGIGGGMLGSHLAGELGASIGNLFDSSSGEVNNVVMDAAVPQRYN